MCKFSLSVSCLNSGTFDEVSTLFLMKSEWNSAFLGTVLEKASSSCSGMSIARITTVEGSLWAVTSSLTNWMMVGMDVPLHRRYWVSGSCRSETVLMDIARKLLSNREREREREREFSTLASHSIWLRCKNY